MHIEHLRTFISVYRLGTMRQAAQTLGMTQPTVTQHIQSLESHLGYPLFSRTKKGVNSLPAADDLAASVSTHLDALSNAVEQRRGLSKTLSGVVRIAMPGEFADYCSSVTCALSLRGIRPHLQLGGRARLYQMLLDNEIDLAITASSPDDPKLDFVKLGKEQLMLIAHPSIKHPNEKEFDTQRVLKYPLIAYDADLALVANFMAQFASQIVLPEAQIFCPDLRTIIKMCAQTPSWSVVPFHIAEHHLNKRSVVSLSGDRLNNDFFLVWQRKSLRSQRIAFAKRYLEEHVSHLLSPKMIK
ncbi:LysR family transcriptional regulator [Glaciecola siphonariae]|uniref:LysR family transcriptional regulator n=1 Tax=Glaciecola siphonariae TaxID=521012 RepID=A0ABV9LYW7_9ALTE